MVQAPLASGALVSVLDDAADEDIACMRNGRKRGIDAEVTDA